MFKLDDQLDESHLKNAANPPEFLEAENVSLRLLLAQAEIDARELLAQAGIDAKEREAADKLQKLILEELHHRIKNTLATVGAIASQSLRHAQLELIAGKADPRFRHPFFWSAYVTSGDPAR